MNRSSPLRAAAVLAAIALPSLALPAAALAQTAPASVAAPTPAHDVEAHIQALHDQLQITPAEAPQWAAFAQVMRENAEAMGQAFQARGAGYAQMNRGPGSAILCADRADPIREHAEIGGFVPDSV